jgi:ATP adenylyltransferase
MAYILSTESEPLPTECIFCSFPAKGPAHHHEHLILADTGTVFVMMNKFPYNNGHLLIIPRRHVADPALLDQGEYAACTEMVRAATAILRSAMTPHGFNVGMNLGRAAGAGIEDHCHWHIVPRWNGDTNFMPVVGEVKVMGDHLLTSYERLVPFFATFNK